MEYRNPKELKPHPISIALYGDNNIEDIKQSIATLGILVPLTITNENLIISGHRRWRCATELNIESIPVEIKAFASKLEENKAIIEFNQQREKTFSQKMNEAKLLKSIVTEEKRLISLSNLPQYRGTDISPSVQVRGKTAEKVGKQVNVGGRDTYSKAEKIWDKAQEGNEQAKELVSKIDTGEKTINRAFKELQATEKRVAFTQNKQELPEDIFDVVYADPPWQYDNAIRNWGPASLHYDTLSLENIANYADSSGRLIKDCVDENAVLFLWVTNPFLQDSFTVLKAWGFEYKTNIVWVKTNLKRPGSGFYVRGRHELLFICTKGSFVPDMKGKSPIGSVIEADVQEHSQKPEEVYSLIENIYPNCKYLELFARNERKGWTSWGNELPTHKM